MKHVQRTSLMGAVAALFAAGGYFSARSNYTPVPPRDRRDAAAREVFDAAQIKRDRKNAKRAAEMTRA
jgi:hypothetical protein